MAALERQEMNTQLWQKLGGPGEVRLLHTTRQAVRYVQETYPEAETLVTHLCGTVLQILQMS